MGRNKSLYLSEDEAKFVAKYLNNFNSWIKEKLHEEMEQTPEFCQKHITYHADNIDKWTIKMKEAEKSQAKKSAARGVLVEECNKRINKDLRMGFLTGKKGKRLLKEAGISMSRFLEEMDWVD